MVEGGWSRSLLTGKIKSAYCSIVVSAYHGDRRKFVGGSVGVVVVVVVGGGGGGGGGVGRRVGVVDGLPSQCRGI